MAIHPSPSPSPARQQGPCPKSQFSPLKAKGNPDIKVASHKLTLQHSVRSQKLDDRQLNKFFKSLEDLKIKRLLQIDKEISEQEIVLEKLDSDKEMAKEQRLAQRGNSSRRAFGDSEVSFILPDHFTRGRPRPDLRRGSSNFDLYAFMMRRESDVTPRNKKSLKKTRSQIKSNRSPIVHRNSSLKSINWEEGPRVTRKAWHEPERRVISPGKSEQLITSPSSHVSAAESISIGSLLPSSPDCDSPSKRFPTGSDRSDEAGADDVNKGFRGRRKRTLRSKQLKDTHDDEDVNADKTLPITNFRATSRNKVTEQKQVHQDEISHWIQEKLPQSDTDTSRVNPFIPSVGFNGNRRRRRRGPPVRKAVSFNFETDDEDDNEHGFVADSLALGAGIMHKNSLLEEDSTQSTSDLIPVCKEPDCIFHNKQYRRRSCVDNDDFNIDAYYRTVSSKPTVSPLFMPTDSPRLWSRSRRQAVRPPSPNPAEFLQEFEDKNVETSVNNLSKSNSFLSVRRPLKGSNRERMLKDKEDNVRTTFKLMRQKMAGQRPLAFNQNYGIPTPNWKILNPLKLRHKINQSNPLHVRWGL